MVRDGRCWAEWGGRGNMCALSKARHLLSGRYCVFVGFFLRSLLNGPVKILSPRRTLGCWRVDKSSCLSQPRALIRSSTSKDWIMACCPHACRSLPCSGTAGDRQSALNLWVSWRKEEKKKKIRKRGLCRQQETEGWCVYIDMCTTRKHLSTYSSTYIYCCGASSFVRYYPFFITIYKLGYMTSTCASPVNSQELQSMR